MSEPDIRKPPRNRAIQPLVLLLILIHLSTVLYTLPLNRVIELRLCQEHYSVNDPSVIHPDGSVPEALCKINDVQQQLAWLQGIMETTAVVCGTCYDVCFSLLCGFLFREACRIRVGREKRLMSGV